jgi:hypothetical protein
LAALAVLGLGFAALAGANDQKPDDKKPAEKKSDKPADWSAFSSAGEVSGEIVKADEDGFTLRISWQTPGKSRANHAKQFRPQNPTEKHQDYQLSFAENGLARWKTLPAKGTDEKGKPVPYTEKERTELRKPSNAPGYAAERGDLKPGHLVDVTLVRPKEISSEKATLADLKVKYAVITGTDPKGPPDTKKDEPKKKKDK